jgi:pimeloyl-ACP methyl ester carboxylesterase
MFNPKRLIFIHGLEGTSQGVKARLLRNLFPEMKIPDFSGSLEERMLQLYSIIGNTDNWTIIGSSLGGLMAAMFAVQRPMQVRRLVLLAPALIWPDFAASLTAPIETPTILYHGRHDELIPLLRVREIAHQAFSHLEFIEVDDDHGLYQTVQKIDWREILEKGT